jgi:ZIP family zinc transporter
VCFYGLDRVIQSHGGRFSQLIAMVSDFIPEAMALGAILLEDKGSALLLVLLIGLQNLPEGFNAYREIYNSKGNTLSKSRIVLAFACMALLGPLSAWLGFEILVNQPFILGGIMLFASGGILYLTFQDIAPQVPLEKHWMPAQGAVAGFALGLVGHLLVQ